jgi:predicted ester cyclase
MSLEENKAILRRAYEVGMNNRDWSDIDEVFAPDYAVYYPGVPPIYGREDAKKALGAFLTAHPDMKFAVIDQLAEGDRVTTRWKGEGTHSGPFAGFPLPGSVVPASGRPVSFGATDIYRIANGQIAEEWNTLHYAGILYEIGALTQSTNR